VRRKKQDTLPVQLWPHLIRSRQKADAILQLAVSPRLQIADLAACIFLATKFNIEHSFKVVDEINDATKFREPQEVKDYILYYAQHTLEVEQVLAELKEHCSYIRRLVTPSRKKRVKLDA
jgi:hypothetical protein